MTCAKKKKKKGFTLIELLVVIAIIGILATIVLVSLGSARLKARDTRRLSDMQQLSLAMEMYYDKNTYNYPPAAVFSAYVAALTANGLIGAAPADPGSNSYQSVTTGADSQAYCFFVRLEQAPTTYVAVSSQSGAGKRSAVPSTATNCSPDL